MIEPMDKLSKLGWESNFDTFFTYYKNYGNYRLIVDRHKDETNWSVTLVDLCSSNKDQAEITINHNATVEWVIHLSYALELN